MPRWSPSNIAIRRSELLFFSFNLKRGWCISTPLGDVARNTFSPWWMNSHQASLCLGWAEQRSSACGCPRPRSGASFGGLSRPPGTSPSAERSLEGSKTQSERLSVRSHVREAVAH